MSDFVYAVVGCGSIGKRHIGNLLACDQEDIIPVDTRADRRQEVKDRFGLGAVSDLEEALAQGANVLFVTLPNALHYNVMREGIEAGCHLFVEKPIAATSEGLRDLLQEARQKHLVGFVGSNFKFHPSFRKMKSLLEQNAIGDVLSVRAQAGQYLPDWHPWEDYRYTYSARSDLGGGILLDSHELTYTTWFLGEVSYLACINDRLSNLEIDTEDTASVLLKMKSGAQAELHLDYTQRAYQRSYEFHGSTGTLRWDIRDRAVKLYEADSQTWTVFEEPLGYDTNQMYLEQTKHFIDCLQGEDEPLTSLEEGLYTLQLIEAAKRSSERKTFVSI